MWRPRIFKVIKEISIYSSYRKLLRKESLDSPKWSKFRLRYDWFGRIYTVINLPPTITNSPDFPEQARPAFVMEEISPINDYVGIDLNLSEVVTLWMEPIKENGGDSFLVVYSFVFRYLTLLWILRFLISCTLLVLFVVNYSQLISFLNTLMVDWGWIK